MSIIEQTIQMSQGSYNVKSRQRQKVYWDIDDVILNTTEAMVELINNKYRIPNYLKPKTREECKDWDFKGLWRPLTKEQQIELFESHKFWDIVTIKPEFYNIVQSGILDEYDNIFVTKGSVYNLFRKKEFLYDEVDIKDIFRKFGFIGIADEEDKSSIDMSNGIQIDDNYSNLRNTKSKIKILLKNNVESTINNSYGKIDTLDNLYNVNSLNEVLDILKFNLVEAL